MVETHLSPDGYVIFLAVICGFTILVASARFWILRHKPRKIYDWISDSFFVLACACSCTNGFICMWKTTKEIELRKENPDMDEQLVTYAMFAPVYLKILFASATLYFCELWFMKGAFIAFYWGLFSRVQTRLKSLLWVATILTICTFVGAFTTHMAWCRPIERNWTSDLNDYSQCASENSMEVLLTTSISNIITDFIVILLPLCIIQRLSLGRLEIYALGFIFLIGSLSVTASVIRLTVLHQIFTTSTVTLEAITQVEMWSITELNVAFLAFTLPSFRKVLSEKYRDLTTRFKSGSGGSRTGASTGLSKRSHLDTINSLKGVNGSIPLQKRETRSQYISMSEEELQATSKQSLETSIQTSTEYFHQDQPRIYGVHAV